VFVSTGIGRKGFVSIILPTFYHKITTTTTTTTTTRRIINFAYADAENTNPFNATTRSNNAHLNRSSTTKTTTTIIIIIIFTVQIESTQPLANRKPLPTPFPTSQT
jgi:hypothetical protein